MNKNNGKMIIKILLIIISFGLACAIVTTYVIKTNKDRVEVKVTNLKDYVDEEHGSKHVVYGEIITKGKYSGKKVRFSTTSGNDYKVGDIVKGKYTNDYFVKDK